MYCHWKMLLLVSFILRQHILEALAVYDADKIDYRNCKLEVQMPPFSIAYDRRIQNKTSMGAHSVVTTLATKKLLNLRINDDHCMSWDCLPFLRALQALFLEWVQTSYLWHPPTLLGSILVRCKSRKKNLIVI